MLLLAGRSRPLVRVVAVIILVGALASGAYYWFAVRGGEATDVAAAASTTSSVAASVSTMEKSVTATGTLTPTVQESVGFEVSGTVTSVAVAAGQQVTAGQTLATVDTLTLNADLLTTKATLASAAAKLSDAEDEDDGTDAATAQIAALAAQVEVAQAQVDTASEAMADATLVSPVAGLLTAVDLAVGDVVSGSSSAGSSSAGSSAGSSTSGTSASGSAGGAGTTTTTASTTTGAFTIVGTESWEVTTTVDDSDVALISVGDQVEMTSDDLTDTVYGTVQEIGLVSTSTSGVAAYPVVVTVTGSPEDLHDGVSVDVEIIYERRTDVLTVPASAVTVVDSESVVTQTDADGQEVTTVVTTGETSGDVVEITAGLVEGDEVLVTVFTRTASQSDQDSGTTEQVIPGGGTGEMPDFGDMPAGGPQMGGQANG